MTVKKTTILALAILAIVYWVLRTTWQHSPQQVMRIGIPIQPSAAILILAQDLGYFDEAGVQVELVEFPSGKRALLDGLLQDKVDLAGTALEAAVSLAFSNPQFRVIASTAGDIQGVNAVVGRRSHGVQEPADLNGKTIATQKNSAVHYFQHNFINHHKIKAGKLQWLKAEELVPALASGEIDAFTMRDPYITEASDLLNNDTIIFKLPSHVQHELLVTTERFVERNSANLQHMLRALLRAETYLGQ